MSHRSEAAIHATVQELQRNQRTPGDRKSCIIADGFDPPLRLANAGIAQAKPQLDVAEQDIDRAMPTNFKGVFHCYTGAVRQMIAQGLPQEVGSVAVSKIVSKPFATLGIYSATMEMAPHKITVNVYAPGIVDTAMWEQIDGSRGLAKGEGMRLYSLSAAWQGNPLGMRDYLEPIVIDLIQELRSHGVRIPAGLWLSGLPGNPILSSTEGLSLFHS
ncbi:hypothetical protein AOCH_007395 [Aspergillus ochraceoroseus]|uniref:Uncharacterized protein n=1 Tax=Aspergillus ochraceoroseus TaxID=138278 RepID=A0A0F8VB53_9EURO|nr:hypothetical protein AOCH_007395 [Aspergillus ochraceoroseus]